MARKSGQTARDGSATRPGVPCRGGTSRRGIRTHLLIGGDQLQPLARRNSMLGTNRESLGQGSSSDRNFACSCAGLTVVRSPAEAAPFAHPTRLNATIISGHFIRARPGMCCVAWQHVGRSRCVCRFMWPRHVRHALVRMTFAWRPAAGLFGPQTKPLRFAMGSRRGSFIEPYRK